MLLLFLASLYGFPVHTPSIYLLEMVMNTPAKEDVIGSFLLVVPLYWGLFAQLFAQSAVEWEPLAPVLGNVP